MSQTTQPPIDIEHLIQALQQVGVPLTSCNIKEVLVRQGMFNKLPDNEIFDIMMSHPQIFILLNQGRWGLQQWVTNPDSEVYRYVFSSKHGGLWQEIHGTWLWQPTESMRNREIPATMPSQSQPIEEQVEETTDFRVRAIIRTDMEITATTPEEAIAWLQNRVRQDGDELIDVLVIRRGGE